MRAVAPEDSGAGTVYARKKPCVPRKTRARSGNQRRGGENTEESNLLEYHIICIRKTMARTHAIDGPVAIEPIVAAWAAQLRHWRRIHAAMRGAMHGGRRICPSSHAKWGWKGSKPFPANSGKSEYFCGQNTMFRSNGGGRKNTAVRTQQAVASS